MSSTFFGLNIAYSGLTAANAAVTTTGNNIANVETKGYTRQEVNQSASDAIKIAETYGMVGSGVTTNSIDRVRNQYYDLKYWNSQSNLGQYEIKKYYTYQIEDYFTETDVAEGFGTIFNSAFDALEEVYKSPGDNTKKKQFITEAGNLCEYFNAMSTNLEKLQQDCNSEIKNKVEEINSIAQEIATLNKQINTIEINKVNANELRDKRELLVDQLSKIVDVEVKETPIYLNGGSTEKSGIYNYNVTIAGGQNLVAGYDYYTLECIARESKVNQSDAEGLYDISWSNGLDFNLYANTLGGELKGLIEMRDGNNEEYFHGTMKTAEVGSTVKDGRTVQTVTVDASMYDYLNDINKCTLSTDGIIKINNKEFMFTGWEYNPDEKTYTFTLSPTDDDVQKYLNSYNPPKTEAAVTIGTKINYKGIPYYQEQMNEWIRQFAKAMNDIETEAVDSEGNQCESLFNATNIIDSSKDYKFLDDSTNMIMSSTADSYYQLTAKNFRVNRVMENNSDKFGTTDDTSKGIDDQSITKKLLTVKNDKEQVNFRGCSAEEFLLCLTSDISLEANSAKTFNDNFENVARAIENQRTSVSGVDNDEEALNLVKYQEAYNLAAKMMQVLTEMYDRLILETGV